MSTAQQKLQFHSSILAQVLCHAASCHLMAAVVVRLREVCQHTGEDFVWDVRGANKSRMGYQQNEKVLEALGHMALPLMVIYGQLYAEDKKFARYQSLEQLCNIARDMHGLPENNPISSQLI